MKKRGRAKKSRKENRWRCAGSTSRVMRGTIAGSPDTVAAKIQVLVDLWINRMHLRFIGEWAGERIKPLRTQPNSSHAKSCRVPRSGVDARRRSIHHVENGSGDATAASMFRTVHQPPAAGNQSDDELRHDAERKESRAARCHRGGCRCRSWSRAFTQRAPFAAAVRRMRLPLNRRAAVRRPMVPRRRSK